jgi:hypothetical protein
VEEAVAAVVVEDADCTLVRFHQLSIHII